MSFKVYDAGDVSMVFMGILIDSGYADGEFLTIEQEEQDFLTKVGTDGEVTRSKSNNRHAVIKLKLMQTSDGNTLLSALNNIDVNTPGGLGVGPMMILDQNGTTVYTAKSCWIAKPPDVSLDRTATSREWTLECASLVRLDGSN